MDNPLAFNPHQEVVTVGRAFGTPLAIQGKSWLPVNELVCWGFFTWLTAKKHPAWNFGKLLGLGGLKMVVFLGSEWCHNLAHTAAARAVGRPVDVIRILFGMPILIYHEPENPSVTPRHHLIRSAAGPIFNLCLLLVSKAAQRLTLPGSAAREVADVAVGMNTFIGLASLTPIPEFDGGPIYKWSLIASGVSPTRTGEVMRSANQVVGMGLVFGALGAVRKQRWLAAFTCALLGGLSLWTGFKPPVRSSQANAPGAARQ